MIFSCQNNISKNGKKVFIQEEIPKHVDFKTNLMSTLNLDCTHILHNSNKYSNNCSINCSNNCGNNCGNKCSINNNNNSNNYNITSYKWIPTNPNLDKNSNTVTFEIDCESNITACFNIDNLDIYRCCNVSLLDNDTVFSPKGCDIFWMKRKVDNPFHAKLYVMCGSYGSRWRSGQKAKIRSIALQLCL